MWGGHEKSEALAMLALFEQFHALGNWQYHFDRARVLSFIFAVRENPRGLAYRDDRGEGAFILATASRNALTGNVVATEHVMFAPNGRGRELVDVLETFAEQMGCNEIALTSQSALPRQGAVNRLYERLGYTQTETVFTRRL